MSIQSAKQFALLLVSISLLAGCGLQYNGVPGFKSYSRQDDTIKILPEINVAENTQTTQPEPAARPLVQETTSRYTHPSQQPTDPVYSSQSDHYSSDKARFAAIDQTAVVKRDDSHARLGLFGQVSYQGRKLSSPLDGTNNISQITFTTEGADFDPEVSPDGEYLAYASTQHRPAADIYVKRVNGTTVTQITTDPAADVMPTFSPDGTKLAFASQRTGNWDLFMVNIDGGAPIQLTNDATDDIHPSFSPDGSQLVYCRKGGQSGQWEMVLLDIANPARKTVIGYGMFPQWSPTDDRILFQRARERGTLWFSVWTVELEDGEAKRPTEIAVSSNAAAITPAWSPDGQQIVFCTVIEPVADEKMQTRQADIWTIAADGTSRRNLVHNQFLNVQPVWARDGAIYFVSNRTTNGMENIWSLRPREIDTVNTLNQGQRQQASAAASND